MSQFDPADDPRGFLVDLLGRYFPAGLVESTIRTWVPVGIGAALSWAAANYSIGVPANASSTLVIITTGAVIAGYYGLARIVERRFPKIGRWMVALNLVKARPVYATDHERVRVLAPGGVIRRP